MTVAEYSILDLSSIDTPPQKPKRRAPAKKQQPVEPVVLPPKQPRKRAPKKLVQSDDSTLDLENNAPVITKRKRTNKNLDQQIEDALNVPEPPKRKRVQKGITTIQNGVTVDTELPAWTSKFGKVLLDSVIKTLNKRTPNNTEKYDLIEKKLNDLERHFTISKRQKTPPPPPPTPNLTTIENVPNKNVNSMNNFLYEQIFSNL